MADYPSIDERDVILSRMKLIPGSFEYESYYSDHPEKRDLDGKMRRLSESIRQFGLRDNSQPVDEQLIQNLKSDYRNQLRDFQKYSHERKAAPDRVSSDPEVLQKSVRDAAGFYDIPVSGVAACRPGVFYTHRGSAEGYGRAVPDSWRYAVVLGYPMKRAWLDEAPGIWAHLAANDAYYHLGIAAMRLSVYIKGLGYDARSNSVVEYDAVMPRLAYEAGLGDWGRMGLIVHKKYGPAIRWTAVFTNMPLIAGKPQEPWISFLCNRCRLCSRRCPGKALSDGELTPHKALPFQPESCYRVWTETKTNCGVCLSVCPVGRPQ